MKTTNTWNECVTSMCKRCLKSASLDLSWYPPRKLRTSSLLTFKVVSSSCFTYVLIMWISKLHWVLTLYIMKDERSHPYLLWKMKKVVSYYLVAQNEEWAKQEKNPAFGKKDEWVHRDKDENPESIPSQYLLLLIIFIHNNIFQKNILSIFIIYYYTTYYYVLLYKTLY